MKQFLVIVIIIASCKCIYPQIRLGLELGVNSVYGNRIKNEYFQVRNSINSSPYNKGFYTSWTNKKGHIFSVGYRGASIDGTYNVKQIRERGVKTKLTYEYIANRYYFSYSHRWKKIRFGGNISVFEYYFFGVGIKSSQQMLGTVEKYLKPNFDAPRKFAIIPSLELAYDFKIKNINRFSALMEIPLWRFNGYNMFYSSKVNGGQSESINIKPKFYVVFLHLRIPLFSICKNWKYFTSKPTKKYDSKECPQ